LKKNDEKIFFDFRLFSGAGMSNTQEKPIKTSSDVKKMYLTRLLSMELKWLENQKLSRDGAEIN
jgi:hypothetical protein